MNIINLNNVIPITLKDRSMEQSDIWNKSLAFSKGEFYLVKANSGSGKSTFINAIYGLRNDYEGSISYDSTSIKNKTSDDLSSFRTNYLSIVFQDLRLFEQLTGRENILLKSEDKTLTELQLAWCDQLAVTKLLDKVSAKLSYGERQRIALIRSLSQPFHFILLDEPFSHLDEENGKKAYDLIMEVASQKNAGVIMTSLGNERFIESKNTLTL